MCNYKMYKQLPGVLEELYEKVVEAPSITVGLETKFPKPLLISHSYLS